MLESLSALHDAILTAAAESEALAKAAEPDGARVAHVRHMIARFSNARAKLLEGIIYPSLLKNLSGADTAKVQRLREERLQGISETARHVAEWGPQRIASEWREYQQEYPKRLAGLRLRVRAEKAILYPLIEKLRAMQLGSVLLIERSLREARAADRRANQR